MKRPDDKKYVRKTIMIDAFNHFKLQVLQSKLIEKTTTTISFSFILEEILRKGNVGLPRDMKPPKKAEQADRVTVMIDEDINKKIQMTLARQIMEAAKSKDQSGGKSYSRIVNAAIKYAFDRGIDKKILKEFQIESERP